MMIAEAKLAKELQALETLKARQTIDNEIRGILEKNEEARDAKQLEAKIKLSNQLTNAYQTLIEPLGIDSRRGRQRR